MYDDITEKLQNLGFNNVEAKIYIALIKFNELNGSQIAKKLNVSRSSVYTALNNLYDKGIVYLVADKTNMYKAKNPDVLINMLKSNFEKNTENLKDELLNLKSKEESVVYYNLKGTENFINKAKEFLSIAEKEVYINTCIDIDVFKEDILNASKRNVRIIIFSYGPMDKHDLPVELYRYPENNHNLPKEIRLMMVADLKYTLICSSDAENINLKGTFTEDKLLAKIVSEHIHHDIYMLKLKQKEKRELINDDIKLNTLLENRRD
ncbi:TrmB family transcriptional regulator [Clostridium sp. BJN0001]|uniref:TrmB family transcriptional regulator n=1 Tax=Clostridium sp. BJN0001 TaxID=2930219 RepID=UPI001FD4BC18|nr:TrmB family transcriptional regulator [Clostridium sp. BJN0001]